MPGLFLSLDGIDGTGKSTQCRLLVEWLRERGHAVTQCVDPGGTQLGDMLRGMVLSRQFEMTLPCEAFLFMASRSELVAQIIRPALDTGGVVVCDRFLLANVVYQGHAGGLSVDDLWHTGRLATGGLEPNLTLVLDMPVDAALIRRGRPADRIETRGADYHERVRAGFLAEAERRPDRIKVVDAQQDVDAIQSLIRTQVEPLLKRIDQ